MLTIGFGEPLAKALRSIRRCLALNHSLTSFGCRRLHAVHCGEAIGSRGVMQGARKVRWPLRCLAVQHSLRVFSSANHSEVKAYALWLMTFAACAQQQRAVVLAPVRMEPAIDTSVGAGQSRKVFETNRDDPFATMNRIDWPGPNRYRSAAGLPGPDYWQQRADYTIAASLDTGTTELSGSVEIRYTNNSPDTLRYVWLQADQNLYRAGSKGSALFPADSRWGVRGFQGGYNFSDVRVNGASVQPRINDTMMRIDLPSPLTPRGGKATIAIKYSFRVPEHGSYRTVRHRAPYEMAQWYPRMAVYDDVRGWNTDPYLGQGEFYLEYGDFDYSVTVPAGYVVAASGVLQNRGEVLTPAQTERLDRAAKSASVVQVITSDEATAAKRGAVAGTKTWRC